MAPQSAPAGLTIDATGGLPVGCPLCGARFRSGVELCVKCHKLGAHAHGGRQTFPLILTSTVDARGVWGYCPGCGQASAKFYDTDEAARIARNAYLARTSTDHRRGHRGRTTTSCPWCRAGVPLGESTEGHEPR